MVPYRKTSPQPSPRPFQLFALPALLSSFPRSLVPFLPFPLSSFLPFPHSPFLPFFSHPPFALVNWKDENGTTAANGGEDFTIPNHTPSFLPFFSPFLPSLPYPILPYPSLSFPILSYPILPSPSFPFLSFPFFPSLLLVFLSEGREWNCRRGWWRGFHDARSLPWFCER